MFHRFAHGINELRDVNSSPQDSSPGDRDTALAQFAKDLLRYSQDSLPLQSAAAGGSNLIAELKTVIQESFERVPYNVAQQLSNTLATTLRQILANGPHHHNSLAESLWNLNATGSQQISRRSQLLQQALASELLLSASAAAQYCSPPCHTGSSLLSPLLFSSPPVPSSSQGLPVSSLSSSCGHGLLSGVTGPRNIHPT